MQVRTSHSSSANLHHAALLLKKRLRCPHLKNSHEGVQGLGFCDISNTPDSRTSSSWSKPQAFLRSSFPSISEVIRRLGSHNCERRSYKVFRRAALLPLRLMAMGVTFRRILSSVRALPQYQTPIRLTAFGFLVMVDFEY